MIYYPETREQHREVAEWVSKQIPGGIDLSGVFYCLGIVREMNAAPTLVFGVVFHNWRDGTCEASMAASTPRWATRQAISAILDYAFNGLGMRRINSISHIKNKRDHRFIEGIGFRRDGVLPGQYRDGAAVIHGMTKRWFIDSKWAVGSVVHYNKLSGSGRLNTADTRA